MVSLIRSTGSQAGLGKGLRGRSLSREKGLDRRDLRRLTGLDFIQTSLLLHRSLIQLADSHLVALKVGEVRLAGVHVTWIGVRSKVSLFNRRFFDEINTETVGSRIIENYSRFVSGACREIAAKSRSVKDGLFHVPEFVLDFLILGSYGGR